MVRFHWPQNPFKENLSNALSDLQVYNICHLVGAIKKVMEIGREKLNEHVLDVSCYISRNNFALIIGPETICEALL